MLGSEQLVMNEQVGVECFLKDTDRQEYCSSQLLDSTEKVSVQFWLKYDILKEASLCHLSIILSAVAPEPACWCSAAEQRWFTASGSRKQLTRSHFCWVSLQGLLDALVWIIQAQRGAGRSCPAGGGRRWQEWEVHFQDFDPEEDWWFRVTAAPTQSAGIQNQHSFNPPGLD